ncbi:unnamed protein product, partial [Allacma fusca]
MTAVTHLRLTSVTAEEYGGGGDGMGIVGVCEAGRPKSVTEAPPPLRTSWGERKFRGSISSPK